MLASCTYLPSTGTQLMDLRKGSARVFVPKLSGTYNRACFVLLLRFSALILGVDYTTNRRTQTQLMIT